MFQLVQNLFECVQMCSNLFKTCSNVFKWVQTCSKPAQMSSNVFKWVQNLFKCVKCVPACPKLVQMCSKLFKNYQTFQCKGSDMTSRAWSSFKSIKLVDLGIRVPPFLKQKKWHLVIFQIFCDYHLGGEGGGCELMGDRREVVTGRTVHSPIFGTTLTSSSSSSSSSSFIITADPVLDSPHSP